MSNENSDHSFQPSDAGILPPPGAGLVEPKSPAIQPSARPYLIRDDDDPIYRRNMIDAGRGHLLR